MALTLGKRQGEALALRWRDVDLDNRPLRACLTRWRPIYAHGCGGERGRPAGFRPRKRLTNSLVGEMKSGAGKRVIGLPDQLVKLLRAHRETQIAARDLAANFWEDGDWVFASPTGQPLNTNSDYHAWKALLRRAGTWLGAWAVSSGPARTRLRPN